MVKRRRRPTQREEVRGNARLRGELHEKDETIASQAATIQSLAQRIASLESQMASRTTRIENLENFSGRSEGFAPSKLVAGNFSAGLLTGIMLSDETITGTKIAVNTIGRARISGRTLSEEEIGTNVISQRALDMTFLDGRYARR